MTLTSYFASIAQTCSVNPNGSIDKTACPSWGHSTLPWTDAMGAISISGFIYLFLTMTGIRSMLYYAVPASLRSAIVVGAGFYITAVGMKMGQLTRTTLDAYAAAPVADALSKSGTISVDLDYRFYENGIVNFNLNPSARIAVLSLVFVMLKYRPVDLCSHSHWHQQTRNLLLNCCSSIV
jgi:xanthine/uracil/vitamin C permease (AzgA family)